jgi:sugar transferase (PEP-CTERM system associated)
VFLLYVCFILSVYWGAEVPNVYLFDDNGLLAVSFVVLVIVLGLYFLDLYNDYRIPSRIGLLQQFCMVLGIAFLTQALFNYGRWNFLAIPRWAMLGGSTLTLFVAPAWRMLFASFVQKAVGRRKLLFVGASPLVHDIIREIFKRPELALAPVGFLDNDLSSPEKIYGSPNLGSVADLKSVVARQVPDTIIVGLSERRRNLPVEDLLQLRLSGIHVEEAEATFQTIFHRVSTRDLRPSELIFSAELGPKRQVITLQSLYSLLIALIGLVIALPVMLIVAVLVKMTSAGPILYRQKRVGFQGEPFMLLKFRSMYVDAETRGAQWATKDDPRVTPLGKWLRKLRLDELPQLFNVLRGEMSIVGPRPERPEFVAILQEKIPYYRLRHCVKPGITGWAQINYKYPDSIEDTIIKLEYDLYYIKNISLSLDVYIMFHTAKTMLLLRGSQ